jgi:heme/copper-type cytochrome/quinol oxidase subunit 2
VWSMLTIWMICTGMRHTLFDMKNWKVSIVLQRLLNVKTGKPSGHKCADYESLIYKILLTLHISLPLCMMFFYVMTDHNNTSKTGEKLVKASYSIWVIVIASSIFFLVQSFYYIN